jgi:hypothetical protein
MSTIANKYYHIQVLDRNFGQELGISIDKES